MIEIILTGTGSPMVDPNRAGPSTLVIAGGQTFLVDCGRGVLMRAAAVGVGAANLTAVLLTHLHSDHITDLSDVITTRWINSFGPAPLPIIGPPGTRAVVEATLAALAPDISYRIGHHADITAPPEVTVHEYAAGQVWDSGGVVITAAPTDHRPVEPTIAFRIEYGGASVSTQLNAHRETGLAGGRGFNCPKRATGIAEGDDRSVLYFDPFVSQTSGVGKDLTWHSHQPLK